MILAFSRTIPLTPDKAWRWLTDPALMNRWSVAHVHTSDGHAADEPGQERIVTVRALGIPTLLHEEIVAAERPSRLAYRVRPNLVVRRHAAEIVLRPEPSGTCIEWTVDIAGWIPGAFRLAVAVVRPQFEASLERLEHVIREPAP